MSKSVQGVARISLPPDSAAVVVVIPAGKEVVREGRKLLVEGIVVDWQGSGE
ncbi:hypothetical protein H5T56_03650 [Candidatus Bipolaricaulota bacterium]|nr:hypothetical protein [Candidatus Bipolaricaulota bacterium]